MYVSRLPLAYFPVIEYFLTQENEGKQEIADRK